MMQVGDVVIAVDGLSVEAETLATVTALLRGPVGSQVRGGSCRPLSKRVHEVWMIVFSTL